MEDKLNLCVCVGGGFRKEENKEEFKATLQPLKKCEVSLSNIWVIQMVTIR